MLIKVVWHLGKGQKGGFFPLAGILLGVVARLVLKKVAAPSLTRVIRKISGRGSRKTRIQRFRRRRF